MSFQQVWEYDGTPHLIMNSADLPNQYTTIPPEDGMYEPIRFDEENKKWISEYTNETKNKVDEDKSEENNETLAEDSFENDIILAELIMTNTELAGVVDEQKEIINEQSKLIASSYLDLAEIVNDEDKEKKGEE